jgi:hypothetical protein
VAGLLYTGSAANRPLTRLAEQLDGESLFGRPLDALDVPTFNRVVARLGVSVVVGLERDVRRSLFLSDNPVFGHRARIGSFIIVSSDGTRAEPEPVGPQRWRVPVTSPGTGGWAPLSIAYSPGWVARAGGATAAVRRDDLGLVQVAIPPGATEVELQHRPGMVDWIGAAGSLLSLALLAVVGVRRARS